MKPVSTNGVDLVYVFTDMNDQEQAGDDSPDMIERSEGEF
jgi:hypothetical protein